MVWGQQALQVILTHVPVWVPRPSPGLAHRQVLVPRGSEFGGCLGLTHRLILVCCGSELVVDFCFRVEVPGGRRQFQALLETRGRLEPLARPFQFSHRGAVLPQHSDGAVSSMCPCAMPSVEPCCCCFVLFFVLVKHT